METLDANSAATLMSGFMDDSGNLPATTNEEPEDKEEKEPEQAVEAEQPEQEDQPTEDTDDPTVTVKIDGKEVEVKLSELKNGYQRQADYTRKTMELSEQRKAVEIETQKARYERQQYADGLQQQAALLQAQLQEQNQIDWQKLLQDDPIKYLEQQHLAQQRQAQLQQTLVEQQRVAAVNQAEQQQAYQSFLSQQQNELLAKLPEWGDETKAKAEREAIKGFLRDSGYTDQELAAVSDHRNVIVARKAMLYDQMMAKAQAAAKKVEKVATKTVKPSAGEPVNLDKRGAAYQKLSKSGSIDDAAAVFRSFL